MAHHADAKKRNRQNTAKRLYNRHYRSTMRSAIKKVNTAIETGDAGAAEAALPAAVSSIHKLVSKNVIHRNQGARRVSRLYAAVKRAKAAVSA